MVKLKGDARDAFFNLDGIYVRDTVTINNEFVWIQESSKNAIWMAAGRWRIGPKTQMGTDTATFCSEEFQQL